jgi:hypothetical protein
LSTETPIGSGINVFTSDARVVGKIRFLDSPDEVIEFVNGPDVAETIVISRGGTTTFMSPALIAGVAGLITLQGAPESHLGILSREFSIPCVMSTAFTEGVQWPGLPGRRVTPSQPDDDTDCGGPSNG